MSTVTLTALQVIGMWITITGAVVLVLVFIGLVISKNKRKPMATMNKPPADIKRHLEQYNKLSAAFTQSIKEMDERKAKRDKANKAPIKRNKPKPAVKKAKRSKK